MLHIVHFAEIMGDVIKATTAMNKTPGKLEWRVLIVDSQSMRMVSACTKMHELSAEGITSKWLVIIISKQKLKSFSLQLVVQVGAYRED